MTWCIAGNPCPSNVRLDPVLRLSSLLMVRDAVLAGAGAGLLPRFIVADDIQAGRLTCWGTVEDRPVTIWALHPSRRLVSTKVAAFLDCLAKAFPGQGFDQFSVLRGRSNIFSARAIHDAA